MIEIERHIEILLLDNDCVIVPGLGGFTAHHVEARFDESDGVFVPPLRTLGFNAQLKINDSLLAQSYVEAYDISYPEALRKIEGEVEELRQRLANEGYYELTDIGVLEINEDGNIEFTPCEAGILTPCLYGLSSFEMQPLADEEETEAAANEEARTEVAPPAAITTTLFDQQKAEPKVDEDDNKGEENGENSEKTICIKVSWLRNTGIAAAAAILILLMITPLSHTGFHNINMGDLNGTSFFSKLMPKDSQMNTIDIKTIKTRKNDSVCNKTECLPKVVKAEETMEKVSDNVDKAVADSFCIIIASSIPKSNADRYVGQLHNQGLDKAYTYVNNNMVRVAYGKYATEGEAYKELQAVRSKKGFEQAWVMKIKN